MKHRNTSFKTVNEKKKGSIYILKFVFIIYYIFKHLSRNIIYRTTHYVNDCHVFLKITSYIIYIRGNYFHKF